MTLDETIDLLSVAAAFDRRTVGKSDAMAWHAALGDLQFEDSRQAVVGHYRDTREWIMPADIRTRVKAIRRDRIARQITPAPPAELTDEPGRYKAAIEASVHRIANGFSVRKAIVAPVREVAPPAEWTEARNALGVALEGAAKPLSPQEIARRQAAESRAARSAVEPEPESGEPAA